MATTRSTDFRYYKVKALEADMMLEFTSLTDFRRFVDEQHLRTIFVLLNEAGKPTHFAVSHKGGIMCQLTGDYKTLEDFQAAAQQQFPDAATFYKALEGGFQSYTDYVLSTQSGINDPQVIAQLKAAGFQEGYKQFLSIQPPQGSQLPEPASFKNAYQLYQYATSGGYEKFDEFLKGYTAGFEKAATWKIAAQHGFTTAADYEEGLRLKAGTMENLTFIREHQLRDMGDFNDYLELSSVKCADCAFDQRLLLTLLSKADKGVKIPLQKIRDKLEAEINLYRYKDTHQMPRWFTRALHQMHDLEEFLKKDEQAHKFGSYHTAGRWFETHQWKSRKVVIDGSNVAHASAGDKRSKPKLANIIKLVQLLHRHEFSDILVILDAALKHRITDPEKMEELKKMVTVTEAPSGTSADVDIIRKVKRHRCLLVSNDKFAEWKHTDPWIEGSINFYRLTFTIVEDDVFMPDLEKKG